MAGDRARWWVWSWEVFEHRPVSGSLQCARIFIVAVLIEPGKIITFHCRTSSYEVWSLKHVIPNPWDVTTAALWPGDAAGIVVSWLIPGAGQSLLIHELYRRTPYLFHAAYFISQSRACLGGGTKGCVGMSGDGSLAASAGECHPTQGGDPHGTQHRPSSLGRQLPLPMFNAGAGGIIRRFFPFQFLTILCLRVN